MESPNQKGYSPNQKGYSSEIFCLSDMRTNISKMINTAWVTPEESGKLKLWKKLNELNVLIMQV
jgi:hypothetical protein